ncbi:MAG: shikimate dehydrogenase [Rhodanobacteraceae bacterium]
MRNPRHAVFGQPIAHSLSPRIHAAFATQFDLPLDYRAIECARGDLGAALVSFAASGGRGANLTSPLKREALASCESLGVSAREAGSVNTLSLTSAGWRGDSTDGAGLLRDLRNRHGIDPAGQRIVLLGAGGSARAIARMLLGAGADYLLIANRSPERAIELASELGAPKRVRVVAVSAFAAEDEADLVIDATSAAYGADGLTLPQGCANGGIFYTLSYGAVAREALSAGRVAGAARVIDGLGMLIEQAAESFAIWHGLPPETTPLYATLRAEFPLAG